MQDVAQRGFTCLRCRVATLNIACRPEQQVRFISTNSSINKGLRKSGRDVPAPRRTGYEAGDDGPRGASRGSGAMRGRPRDNGPRSKPGFGSSFDSGREERFGNRPPTAGRGRGDERPGSTRGRTSDMARGPGGRRANGRHGERAGRDQRDSARTPGRPMDRDGALRTLARGGRPAFERNFAQGGQDPEAFEDGDGHENADSLNSDDRGGRLGPSKSRRQVYDVQDLERPYSEDARAVKRDRRGDEIARRDRYAAERESNQSGSSYESNRNDRDNDRGSDDSIPGYTTAASSFLYGRRSVLATLKSRRRKFYAFYLNNDLRDSRDDDIRASVDLATEANIPIKYISRWVLDKLVQQTARQAGEPASITPISDGMCLEASPFPEIPVRSLGRIDEERGTYGIALEAQTREDAAITGRPTHLQINVGMRKPLLLWLHGTVNMRNVGAILRTCLYFGVDVLLSRRGTAAGTGLLRTSVGASEFLDLLRVGDENEFIKQSQYAGWKFYSAVAPGGSSKIPLLGVDAAPLMEHPCVIVMGNEDDGLPKAFTKLTDGGVTVGGRTKLADAAGVDSLNVGIAAALLIQQFLRSTKDARRVQKKEMKKVEKKPKKDVVLETSDGRGSAKPGMDAEAEEEEDTRGEGEISMITQEGTEEAEDAKAAGKMF